MIKPSMPESDTLLIHMDKIPPNLCRVLARNGRLAKTNKEISEASGLTLKRVGEISRLTTWAKVDVNHASAFAAACGVDLVNQGQVRKYLLRTEGCRMGHIKVSPNRRYLTELLNVK
jgi:hypothetical protein